MDPVWEKLHASRFWGKYPSDHLVQTVLRRWQNIEERKSLRALELGCGAGANLSFLLTEGFQVSGVDGSASAIKRAQSRMVDYTTPGQKLDLSVCYFEDLDFEPKSFDLVVDFFAVYANQKQVIERVIKGVHTMLCDGGMFYSRVWGMQTEGSQSGKQIEEGTSENPTCGPCADMGVSHFFTAEELNCLYSDWSNFTLTRVLSEQYPSEHPIEEFVIWAQK